MESLQTSCFSNDHRVYIHTCMKNVVACMALHNVATFFVYEKYFSLFIKKMIEIYVVWVICLLILLDRNFMNTEVSMSKH